MLQNRYFGPFYLFIITTIDEGEFPTFIISLQNTSTVALAGGSAVSSISVRSLLPIVKPIIEVLIDGGGPIGMEKLPAERERGEERREDMAECELGALGVGLKSMFPPQSARLVASPGGRTSRSRSTSILISELRCFLSLDVPLSCTAEDALGPARGDRTRFSNTILQPPMGARVRTQSLDRIHKTTSS